MPEMAESFLEKLEIERFFGVGKVTAQRMHELGIKNGYDLKQFSELELVRNFGKNGSQYYHFVRGVDDREVESEQVRKSLGAEETFSDDLYKMVDLLRELDEIAREVNKRAVKRKFMSKTLTLKVKYADFNVITRTRTVDYYLRSYEQLFELGKELLLQLDDIESRKVRLLGLTLKNSQLNDDFDDNQPTQLSLDFKE